MADIILGMVGMLLSVIIFFVGVAVGSIGNRSKVKKWLDEHGCYTCAEKWDNPFNGKFD